MKRRHRWLVLGALVTAASVINVALSPGLSAYSFRPNLGLCCLIVCSLFTGPNTASALGFWAGLLEASYAATDLGSLIVSRTLAGFGVGILEERIFRDHVLVAVAATFLGTLGAEGCFFLFAPQPHAGAWAIATLNEAFANALLATPVYYGTRWIVHMG
jgi:rod shape-determining protein MreD